MDSIKKWNKQIQSQKTLYIIDSCFSGLAGSVPKSDSRKLTLDQLSQPSNQLLTAGSENEETIALDGIGSLFTSALLSGLRGNADASMAGFQRDGIISVTELKMYIQRYVALKKDKHGWTKTITPQTRDLSSNEGEFFFVYDPGNKPVVTGGGKEVPVLTSKGGYAADRNLSWYIMESPKKIKFHEIKSYINNITQKTNATWGLPTFHELAKAKKSGILGHYSKLEVWAEATKNQPATFDLEHSNAFSTVNPNKDHYILLNRKLR